MAHIQIFTFNPFEENTYLIYDDSGECAIIDPGCHVAQEEIALSTFISEHSLKPVKLLNTHCHIDHILGNAYVAGKYGLELGIHKEDLKILEAAEGRSAMWGVQYTVSPAPGYYIEGGDSVSFGNTRLEVRFVPGHAPGHIIFINHTDKTVIAGDTLFRGSIGRTDLPFGDFNTLERAVREQMYTLPDDYEVFPGHGPSTAIGLEKKSNPFIRPT